MNTKTDYEIPTVELPRATDARNTCHLRENDLYALPINGVVVLAVVVELAEANKAIVSWGDTAIMVRLGTGLCIQKSTIRPEAGQFIGHCFASNDDARKALRPFLMVPECGG